MARNGFFIEDLTIGQSADYTKTISDADILLFAGVSGDTNPVHIDETYAQGTMFKGRIAHGMLSASFLSTVFGTLLPGPGAIYMSQNLRFKAPVRIGDTVTARVTVSELFTEKKRVKFDCVCLVKDVAVIEGDAMLMVPARAK